MSRFKLALVLLPVARGEFKPKVVLMLTFFLGILSGTMFIRGLSLPCPMINNFW